MSYGYQTQLRSIWEHAVERYRNGGRDAAEFFDANELGFLKSIGATAQEIFDFAEDYVAGGDPDYDTFALVTDRRRSFFLHVLKGKWSGKMVMNDELPPKDAEVEGITWLPRIHRKAKVKLYGEMNPDLMYGCGGDRRFLREIDMHLAEFLALVERNLDNDRAVVDFVVARKRALESTAA